MGVGRKGDRMKKITEEQAREMLSNLNIYCSFQKPNEIIFHGDKSIKDGIEKWKEDGYIKESALNRAKEKRRIIQEEFYYYDKKSLASIALEMAVNFEEYIKELQEKQ